MPISPLPLSDRISTALRDRLAAIVGDNVTYSYTPDEVKFVEDIDVGKLPRSKQLVFWLLQGDRRPEERTNLEIRYSDYFSMFAAYRAPTGASATEPRTVRSLIAEDVERAIATDVTLGGLARNTEITEVSRDIRVDNTVQWICLSFLINVTSRVLRSAA